MEIKIHTGSSEDSAAQVLKAATIIGEIKKVSHSRKKNSQPFFETIITGKEGKIIVLEDLSSGFNGRGPDELTKVLLTLGFDKQDVEYHVLINDNNEHTFTLEK
ncbi:hypothetical protein [Rummeliibacillus pycnus]|uniref:hypothetical protein n=1 Tax=Rummeliibacillus pycnus TaxID=101070 RepID=UPI000C9A79C2|nr:hypothetical protein [Rummeliibacillus pycnus]